MSKVCEGCQENAAEVDGLCTECAADGLWEEADTSPSEWTVEVKLSSANAAFGEDEFSAAQEVARILLKLADAFAEGSMSVQESLMDVNGNKVGTVYVSEKY